MWTYHFATVYALSNHDLPPFANLSIVEHIIAVTNITVPHITHVIATISPPQI